LPESVSGDFGRSRGEAGRSRPQARNRLTGWRPIFLSLRLVASLRALWKIVNAEELRHRYLMRPGDLHIFDNHRVLHGREAFDPASGARHLQQCSVNRDEFHNRLGILAAKLERPASELVIAGGAVG